MSVRITYFVHGTTSDNKDEISSGWKDVDLSSLGVQQSIDLKKKINISDFSVAFCSDLLRAVHSAELTFKGQIPIKIDSRLREWNYGDYNGKPSEMAEPVAEKCMTTPFPNGESFEDVQKIIFDFLADVKKEYDGEHIAIVAHKAPQLSLDIILRGKTREQAFAEDWRKTKSWQAGWQYKIKD